MEQVLECMNVEKMYGTRGMITKALNGVSFSMEQGDFIGIMGASGSGKTTLLNCISTIDRVTAGHIFVGSQNITTMSPAQLSRFRRKSLGFIFQDFNLLDTLTAFENIALALTIQKIPAREIESRVRTIASELSIRECLEKYPYELSGGQQQRVAAARAIVTRPTLVLADEPTGALDSKAAKVLLECFSTLNNNLGASILMVTHDALVASYAKRILFIQDGKIFSEVVRGDLSRKQFFNRIISVVSFLGGEENDVW